MSAAEAIKFHASLNVSDLARSIDFYRALFGVEPAKRRADYAKFETEEPPIVLSLIPGQASRGGNLNHAGLRVRNSEDLVEIQHRLEAAGIRTQREEGVECCYARQTKFWVADPDAALWEIYVLHEDIDEHGDDLPPAVEAQSFAQEIPRARIVWQHQISQAIPAKIPHEDNSVHEIVLEGTANLKPRSTSLAGLLKEAFRALRPGGEIRLHGLAGDAPLPDAPLSLPGPAAAVQYVPAVSETAEALRRAGFVNAHFEKLSDKAWFEVAGVGLREILVTGRKPGHRPRAAAHIAIYLGPLAQITDDFGNVFPRGQRVALNIHDWQALQNGPAASSFLLLAPKR